MTVEVRLNNRQTACICTVYRSPNSDFTNNGNLNMFLKSLSNKGFSQLLIVGDFNYSCIDWKIGHCLSGVNSAGFQFVETIRDCFLYQHILEPTRGRGSDKPSLIDLVLTNEKHTVDSVVLEAPLGKSDHALLKVCVNCTVVTRNYTPRRMYDKGDYEQLRRDLDIDWHDEFTSCGSDIESMWNLFSSRLHQAVEKSIPICRMTTKKKNSRPNKRTPLDDKTIKKIKRKNRLWKQFTKTGNESVHKEYCQVRNQIRRLTRNAQKNKEKMLAEEIKINPKKFWKHVGNKTKSKFGIPNLVCTGVKTGVTTNDKEKADVLAEFFSSVYTREPDGNWDLPEGKQLNQSLVIWNAM